MFWIALFLMVFGVASFGLTSFPYEWLKGRLDSFTSDGSADPFTPELFEQIVARLKILGMGLIGAGVFLYLFRRKIGWMWSRFLPLFSASFRDLRLDLTHRLREGIQKEGKLYLSTLGVLILLAICVRFLFQPMRYDEAVTFIYYASKPLYVTLSNYYAPNNHLLHTLLVKACYLLFGNQPWVLRLPAFIAGVLLVPASYGVARLIYNKQAALLTAGLVAASSAFIEYSTNARGYTLLCLIFLLIVALAADLKQHRSLAGWFLFVVLSALGFYTIPIMLYPFGTIVVWLFLSGLVGEIPNRRLFLRDLAVSCAGVGILTAILYTPVFLTWGFRLVVGNPFSLSQSWPDFLRQLPGGLRWIWDLWNRDIPAGISLLLAAGFWVWLVFHRRLTQQRSSLLLAAVIWCVPVIFSQKVVPYGRVSLFLLPLYAAAAAAGLVYLAKPLRGRVKGLSVFFSAGVVALSMGLGARVVSTQSLYDSEQTGLWDAEPIALFLKGYLQAGDRVVASAPADAPLIYYFNLYGVSTRHLYGNLRESRRILAVVNETIHQTLQQVLEEAGSKNPGAVVPRVIRRYKFATLYEING